MRIATILILLLMAGCSGIPKAKLLETDTPEGYRCKTHGENKRSYKVGLKYLCKICVDENIGQVEMFLPTPEDTINE